MPPYNIIHSHRWLMIVMVYALTLAHIIQEGVIATRVEGSTEWETLSSQWDPWLCVCTWLLLHWRQPYLWGSTCNGQEGTTESDKNKLAIENRLIVYTCTHLCCVECKMYSCLTINIPTMIIWKSTHLAQALQRGIFHKPECMVRLVYMHTYTTVSEFYTSTRCWTHDVTHYLHCFNAYYYSSILVHNIDSLNVGPPSCLSPW